MIDSKSSKDLWKSIDWKGNVSSSAKMKPSNEELAVHFEKLYSCDNDEESSMINELTTDAYVSALDDPITNEEINSAMNEMKKGGFDYGLNILKILMQLMSPILVLLFNIMFYVEYPATLARSLLTALPKKGNLSLPTNFRGIQMLAALSALYDRVITIRIRKWCSTAISYVQSAFQKGKSCIHQLFTLRLLIEIAKSSNTTLYIGFFDIAKAFDKVSTIMDKIYWQ